TAALFYFQFVFAAITPLLFLGSVLGRIKIKVWIIFVPLWTTFVYAVNAMLLWGGGYWAHEGAVDYSGGYVIHLAAGTSGFVAAWVIGPRLARDRQRFLPHSLPFVSVGHGMIVGLVAITPGAGYVNGFGAMLSGIIASVIEWFAWTYLQPILIKRVDDAMGVLYTHGIARLCGGLLVGIFADPTVVVYPFTTSGSAFAAKGWFYGNGKLFELQLLAALTVIVWDAVMTFIILKVISIFTPLRMSDEDLEIGDLAVHGEEAYPSDEGFARV